MPAKRFGVATIGIMAIALAVAGLSVPAAAQGVGAIGGNVVDSSGGGASRSNVALSNPGVIGGTQETITDDEEPTNLRGSYPVPTVFARR